MESEKYVSIRTKAQETKYLMVNVQQFLTDASATGDSEGIDEAQQNMSQLNQQLDSIVSAAPEFKKLADPIRVDANKFLKLGIEMANTYMTSGKEAGNALMQRPGDGFDAYADRLAEEIAALEKLATEKQARSEQAMITNQHQLLIQTILLSVIEFFIMIGIFWALFRRTLPLEAVVHSLTENAGQLESASSAVSSSATAISSATSQQASATQQTAASLEQIRAMVGKTAENSSFLQERAEETNQSVSTGKVALDAVIQTIEDIRASQNRIVSDVEQTNSEIGKIVALIGEIGNKTKVINEIVFQTKLLSFNASVEAARAGEHGRGFAVVAEEVGGLAQMSGAASKEISDLLENSVQKVEAIVEEGRQRLSLTLNESISKIEHGVETAHRCEESFETIISQMQAVNSTTTQTSNAIQETVKGIDEISKALEELDQSTRSNAETSQVASSTSHNLNQQLFLLKDSISAVGKVIGG
jgi:methyl-accepting chemotaxis protein